MRHSMNALNPEKATNHQDFSNDGLMRPEDHLRAEWLRRQAMMAVRLEGQSCPPWQLIPCLENRLTTAISYGKAFSGGM